MYRLLSNAGLRLTILPTVHGFVWEVHSAISYQAFDRFKRASFGAGCRGAKWTGKKQRGG